MKQPIEKFDAQLTSERHKTGSYPFTRDIWVPYLSINQMLHAEGFQPGDKVRVTVERV